MIFQHNSEIQFRVVTRKSEVEMFLNFYLFIYFHISAGFMVHVRFLRNEGLSVKRE